MTWEVGDPHKGMKRHEQGDWAPVVGVRWLVQHCVMCGCERKGMKDAKTGKTKPISPWRPHPSHAPRPWCGGGQT